MSLKFGISWLGGISRLSLSSLSPCSLPVSPLLISFPVEVTRVSVCRFCISVEFAYTTVFISVCLSFDHRRPQVVHFVLESYFCPQVRLPAPRVFSVTCPTVRHLPFEYVVFASFSFRCIHSHTFCLQWVSLSVRTVVVSRPAPGLAGVFCFCR